MSVEYCHAHHRYYDTDFVEDCYMCQDDIKNYLVSWWCEVNDQSRDYYQTVEATSEEQAIEIVKSQNRFIHRAGKHWEAKEK